MIKTPKVNYLNNKDILKEIHKSKMSFCYLEDEKYSQQDIILDSYADIFKVWTIKHRAQHDENGDLIADAWVENTSNLIIAKENQAKRFKDAGYAEAMVKFNAGDVETKPRQKDSYVDPATIKDSDVVFRVMTFDHIPEEEGRKKNPKNVSETKAKVNFPPFKHYAIDADSGEICEVARSHWKGDINTGHFSVVHSKITFKLGSMFLKLVDKYSHRANWRGYTYVDEMRGQALVQLSYIGLQFNEDKSDNLFAYYTAVITNSFRKVLLIEKKNQGIRDDILIDQGHLPSYTRQLQHDEEIRNMRSEAEESEDV